MRKPKLYKPDSGRRIVVWYEFKHGKYKRRTKEYSPKDKEKADEHFAELQRRYPVVGAAGMALDAEQRADFFAARAILPEGVSMADAARFYVAQTPEDKPLDIDKAFEEWLEFAARTDKSLRTGKDRKNRVRKFIEDKDLSFVTDIEEHAEDWLFRGVSAQTTIQEASHLRGFCRWLVQRKKALPSNPIDKIPLPSADDPDPRTLDAEQVESIMRAAIEWPFPGKSGKRTGLQNKLKGKMVPFFAICIFAGLRPSEVRRLTKDTVKLDAKEPFMRVRKLKRGRGVRLTPISETLKAWLEAYPLSYPVYFSDKGFKAIRKEAGVFDDWDDDMPRHTCISAWLGLGRNEDEVASWSGNSPKIIHRYYRELLTPDESKAVFEVSPNNLL